MKPNEQPNVANERIECNMTPANERIGYYYILASGIVKEHFLKLGITTRHPRYRFAEHKTSHSAYTIHTIYKLQSIDELKLLEKYILAKTIDFIYDTTDINNECRYKLNPNSVCEMIVDYLDKRQIKYDKLDLQKLDDEPDYVTEDITNGKHFSSLDDCANYLIEIYKRASHIKLRDYQIDAIQRSIQHYALANSGILNWACGLGKTITAIYLLIEYANKTPLANILIGVPSVAILKQWAQVIQNIEFFEQYQLIAITGADIPGDIITTTNPDVIRDERYLYNTLIITTYISSHLIADHDFDFAIFDEVHHLAGKETAESRGYKQILNSKRSKTLSLSATLKDTDSVSNFDIAIFGDIIDAKSIQWAIDNKFITDYRLLVMETNAYIVNNILPNFTHENIELYLAAFSVLYGMYNKINGMSHTFIYTNDIKDSAKLLKCIKKILKKGTFIFDDIFYGKVDSYEIDVELIIKGFRSAKCGIIICVYMLNEGYDDPIIDSVCFSKSMISKIRSIQSLLRGNRLLAANPNKINTVIFPTADIEDVYSSSFGALIDVIRNEDKNIEEKISFISIGANGNVASDSASLSAAPNAISHTNLTTNIKYKLFESKRMTPLERFNYYVNYNKQFNFICITDYIKRARLDTYHLPYIANPEIEFMEVWNQTAKWYGFLSIDCSKFPLTKDTWKLRCVELGINSAVEYDIKCIDNNLPIDYHKYYDLNTGFLPWGIIQEYDYYY